VDPGGQMDLALIASFLSGLPTYYPRNESASFFFGSWILFVTQPRRFRQQHTRHPPSPIRGPGATAATARLGGVEVGALESG
jgi:hypothetical protein